MGNELCNSSTITPLVLDLHNPTFHLFLLSLFGLHECGLKAKPKGDMLLGVVGPALVSSAVVDVKRSVSGPQSSADNFSVAPPRCFSGLDGFCFAIMRLVSM